MLFLGLFLTFTTVAIFGYIIIPALYDQASRAQKKQQQRLTNNMEQIMSREKAKKLNQVFIFAPIILGAMLYITFPPETKLIGLLVGAVGGVAFPGMYIRILTVKTRQKFNDQLVDALMIMSSSFRGGLSLVQALEAVVDEMPDPINKEFGIVLGENKMGVSLEEALYHMHNRMPSVALQQMITAILLARETGGNLPAIFNRIVNNIRENKKIQQSLDTLTVQGKIQGFVMTLLPVAFGYIVYNANRRIFEHMLTSELGRALLTYAFISWLIGAYLIVKISTFKDF